jgi:hypothetical protein
MEINRYPGANAASTLAKLVVVMVLLGTLMGLAVAGSNLFSARQVPVYASAEEVAAIEVALNRLGSEVATLKDVVSTLSSPRDASLDAELAQIEGSLNSLDDRLGKIEQAILDDPTKALELTLLVRDVEDIEEKHKADLQSVRDEIARLYDFNQWFLGVVIFGILGLAVTSFLAERRKVTEAESPERAK